MSNIEKQMASEIAKTNGLTIAKLGLRFDRVASCLLGSIRQSVEPALLNGEVLIMTVTAPIRVPAKTSAEIEQRIKEFLDSGIRQRDQKLSIFQNQVSIRLVTPKSKGVIKFVGLVHNPSTDSKLLLNLATQWLAS